MAPPRAQRSSERLGSLPVTWPDDGVPWARRRPWPIRFSAGQRAPDGDAAFTRDNNCRRRKLPLRERRLDNYRELSDCDLPAEGLREVR
jgi:hypothetical protein